MENEQRNSIGAEAEQTLEFQLLLRQRKINDLLSEIEELREVEQNPRSIPVAVDRLIETLTKDVKANDEEIHLLQHCLSASEESQFARSIQERLREAIAQNVSLGYELGVDNLRGLYVERDLLKRENELLKETEQDMKQSLDDLTKQKNEADSILERYISQHGSLETDKTAPCDSTI